MDKKKTLYDLKKELRYIKRQIKIKEQELQRLSKYNQQESEILITRNDKFMMHKEYKDSDYGLVLIHPWRGKILVSKVLVRFYYGKDGSISCLSYRKYSDPSKWYSKIGRPNEYIYGKILSTNDKEAIDRNIQRIRDHLLEYRKDTGKRVDRNTYNIVEYKD